MSAPDKPQNQIDRRLFLAATTGAAALVAGCSALGKQGKTPASGKKASGVRILGKLNSREPTIPCPNAFHRNPIEDKVTFTRLGLNLKKDRIPARLQRYDLIGVLPMC